MDIRVEEVSPQQWRDDADEIARRHGHIDAPSMWDAIDRGEYRGHFSAKRMLDLRAILRLCEDPHE